MHASGFIGGHATKEGAIDMAIKVRTENSVATAAVSFFKFNLCCLFLFTGPRIIEIKRRFVQFELLIKE